MSPETAEHPFKDEWSFQRSMSRGNPVAGKSIDPEQPCFVCGTPFAAHAQPPDTDNGAEQDRLQDRLEEAERVIARLMAIGMELYDGGSGRATDANWISARRAALAWLSSAPDATLGGLIPQ